MALPLNTSDNPNDPATVARYHMVQQQIRPWNVSDEAVLELLLQVPREDFTPTAYRGMAFMDMEIPLLGTTEQALKKGHCMLAPKIDARLLQELLVQPGERVLEIGTGSGYLAALLGGLTQHVVSLEIEPLLVEMARDNLQRAGIHHVEVRHADGSQEGVAEGPFDAIVLSGSVAEIPQHLLAQLRDGGRLVAIVGYEPMMRTTVVRRQGNQFTTTQPWDTVAPRLQGFAEPSRFQF